MTDQSRGPQGQGLFRRRRRWIIAAVVVLVLRTALPLVLRHVLVSQATKALHTRVDIGDVDLALLPINGDVPERRVAGNLDGREAATLAKEIGARLVIPCHYDMFKFNTASPDLFVATARELGQPYRVLRCGERWSSSELPV